MTCFPTDRWITLTEAEAPVSLRGIRVSGRITAMAEHITLELSFTNVERRPVEIVHTIPLPARASVCGVELLTGDRTLSAEVEDAEEAAEKYRKAIRRGDAAMTVDQERDDVFSVRLGNLRPRQSAVLRISYVRPVEVVERALRVAIPTTVPPRYIPAGDLAPADAAVDDEILNPPFVEAVPYGLSLELDIDLDQALGEIASPSHPVVVGRSSATRASVRLRDPHVLPDRQFRLDIALDREGEAAACLRTGTDGRRYAVVTFKPEFDESDPARPEPLAGAGSEVQFVLDCSGSMEGESITQAVRALRLCLRSLAPGDRFNIVRFGSSHKVLSKCALLRSPENLQRAAEFIDRGANLGGTELLPALKAALGGGSSAHDVTGDHEEAIPRKRDVILLTDGQVSNDDAIVKFVSKHPGCGRIFAFGIGPACGESLLRRIAAVSGGGVEFIDGGEAIEPRVLRTFARMASPRVTEVTVRFEGGDAAVEFAPAPRVVFDGEAIAVIGRVSGAGSPPTRARLTCDGAGGPRSWSLDLLDAGDASTDSAIAPLWAKSMLEHLHQALVERPGAEDSELPQQAIALSCETGVLCALTTLIAVEHRSPEERLRGLPAQRRIPVQLPAGWGGSGTWRRALGTGPMVQYHRALPANMVMSCKLPDIHHFVQRDLFDLRAERLDRLTRWLDEGPGHDGRAEAAVEVERALGPGWYQAIDALVPATTAGDRSRLILAAGVLVAVEAIAADLGVPIRGLISRIIHEVLAPGLLPTLGDMPRLEVWLQDVRTAAGSRCQASSRGGDSQVAR